jgi:hypothetical protein
VKVCPHCAEELPDEATVCPTCHKNPAEAPAWAAPRPPAGASRLGDVWEPNGVLPSSERVPAPFKPSEAERRPAVPPIVWASLLLWCSWGWIAPVPSGVAGLILMPAGYAVGLIFAIWGEVQASDPLGRRLATLAIILNGMPLVSTIYGMLRLGLAALRG